MRITYSGWAWATVEYDSLHEEEWLVAKCRCTTMVYGYDGRPTQQTYSLLREGKYLPLGWLPDIVAQAQTDGIDVHLDPLYLTCRPNKDMSHKTGGEGAGVEMGAVCADGVNTVGTTSGEAATSGVLAIFRDYQLEAHQIAVEKERGVLTLATGAGKGWIAAGLMDSIPIPWIYLAPSKQLCNDVKERFNSKSSHNTYNPVYWTYQKAGKMKKKLEKFPENFDEIFEEGGKRGPREGHATSGTPAIFGVIADECHSVGSDGSYEALMSMHHARYRIGLSATPFDRSDGYNTRIVGALGRSIFGVSGKFLIDNGYLAAPNITMVEYEHDVEPFGRGKTACKKAYTKIIHNGEGRNELVAGLAAKANGSVLVFVEGIAHGKNLVSIIRSFGLNSEFVDGKTPANRRDFYCDELERGAIDVLVASNVFKVGVDMPSLNVVIMAGGNKSKIGLIQRIGRGMRHDEGKKMTFEVIDILDKGEKFTEKHAKDRKKTYEREGYDVTVR